MKAFVAFTCLAALFVVPLAEAASYDGTYRVTYHTSNGNYGGSTSYDFTISVSGGRVSATRTTGTISSGGSVSFTISSMCGNYAGTFTGTVGSGGSWSCGNSQGSGTWTITRLSGGDSGGGGGTKGTSTGDSSWAGPKAFVGTMSLVAGLAGLALSTVRAGAFHPHGGAQHRTGVRPAGVPSTSPGSRTEAPAAPTRLSTDVAAPVTPIVGAQDAFQIRDRATVVGTQNLPPPLGSLTVAAGTNLLTWTPPDGPPLDGCELFGYRILALVQGPQSTAAQPVWLGDTNAGTTSFQPPAPFVTQTYQWNTGGDIHGYVVEPLYRYLDNRFGTQLFPGAGTFRGWQP